MAKLTSGAKSTLEKLNSMKKYRKKRYFLVLREAKDFHVSENRFANYLGIDFGLIIDAGIVEDDSSLVDTSITVDFGTAGDLGIAEDFGVAKNFGFTMNLHDGVIFVAAIDGNYIHAAINSGEVIHFSVAIYSGIMNSS